MRIENKTNPKKKSIQYQKLGDCLRQKFGLVRNLVWYIWLERVKTRIQSLWERQKSSVSGAAEFWRFWPFHKATNLSIYLSIYLSIIDYRNSPMLLSNATLPLPNYTDFGTKLLWRHDIFVGHIPKVMDLAPVSRFWSKIVVAWTWNQSTEWHRWRPSCIL
jgi:hypothetical protein